MQTNAYPGYARDDSISPGLNGMNGYASNGYASSSSNPYPDYAQHQQPSYGNNLPMRQPPQPSIHGGQHQPQWPGMMQQSTHQQQQHHQQVQHQHSQRYNNGQNWQQQQHGASQTFNNGMPGMGMSGYGLPFAPQHVVHDALPVANVIQLAEESIILQALLRTHKTRETYKDALNSLHGKNGHPANIWKDHYLDHKHRLDKAVAEYFGPPVINTQKPPMLNMYKTESTPPLPSPASAVPSKRKGRGSQQLGTQSPPPTSASSGRRSTINSLTSQKAAYDHNLPPPHADIRVPDPPSRSPTPPTTVVSRNGRGNRFTPEDKDFFIKLISWQLRKEPSTTRNQLCEILSQKAPHHSSQSWYAFWSSNHDLPDKILASANGEGGVVAESSEISSRKRPRYKEESSDNEDEDADGDEDPEDDLDVDEDLVISEFDESAMGLKGGPFTEADTAVCARHVSTFTQFADKSFQEKWVPFGERYPQRSAKSWAEFYRRNERRIDRLAAAIRRHQTTTESAVRPKIEEADQTPGRNRPSRRGSTRT